MMISIRALVPLLLLGAAILAPLNMTFLDKGEPEALVTDYAVRVFRDYCLKNRTSLARAEGGGALNLERNNPRYAPSAELLKLLQAACAKKGIPLNL